MTRDDIVRKLKESLNHQSGMDYYDYTGSPHWWGCECDLERFAEELLQDLDKDKSPGL